MARHAIISGGSSGIGLASARQLLRRGNTVSLIARDEKKLAAAAESLRAEAASGAEVNVFAADVSRNEHCRRAVEQAISRSGPPEWVVASAGIVRPGKFLEQTADDHRMTMDTNYFGTVHLAYAAVPPMVAAGGGRLVLLSSGAAFVGLYGYSSYGPSKFAIRGLAESLKVELRPKGVSVTLVCPGDTDTPQLEAELPLRPLVTSKLAEGAKVMSPDDVAKRFIAAAERGKFLVTYGLQLHALSSLQGVIGPALRVHQQRLIKRFGEGK